MNSNIRSNDVYEEIDGYSKPPIVPLPDLDDFESLQNFGLKINNTSRRIVKAGSILTGFRSFQKNLPNTIEGHLRKNNLRLPGLFSPAISATLALADDSRNITSIQRAATLILAVKDFCNDVFQGKLSQDQFRDQGLEMGQYPNLFSTCLVVNDKGVHVFKSQCTSQITVIVTGQFFILDIGERPGFNQLCNALIEIVRDAHRDKRDSDYVSPGPLTAATNETQFKMFKRLRKIQQNSESLEALQHSLFTLCLELEGYPSSAADAAFRAQSNNYQNRWFHSALQVVVFGNARAAAICNFTVYTDGNTMMRSAAEIQKRAAIVPLKSIDENEATVVMPAKKLEWRVNRRAVWRAYRNIRMVLDNQQATFEISNIGRIHFSEHGIDAVPAFIAATQMAMHRLTGAWVNIDQFLTMTKYRCMDLTTTTVTTPELIRFAELVENKNPDRQEVSQALGIAIVSQTEKARAARKYLKLGIICTLYLRSLGGPKKVFVKLILFWTVILLKILGLLKSQMATDMLVSHPEIYAEVPVVGRPGIRLPYVKYLGLHYQIFDEKILITLMPGLSWHIPNTEFIYTLRECLECVQWAIQKK